MKPKDILDAVGAYLDVLERPMSPADRIVALRAALDGLAVASHCADAPFDDRPYPDPPTAEYQALRARIAPLFPELGYYNVVAEITGDLGKCEVFVGDAMDDIVDIASDLLDVVSRSELTSEVDAIWHFRLTFTFHWGEHLRNLQLYLHRLEY